MISNHRGKVFNCRSERDKTLHRGMCNGYNVHLRKPPLFHVCFIQNRVTDNSKLPSACQLQKETRIPIQNDVRCLLFSGGDRAHFQCRGPQGQHAAGQNLHECCFSWLLACICLWNCSQYERYALVSRECSRSDANYQRLGISLRSVHDYPYRSRFMHWLIHGMDQM